MIEEGQLGNRTPLPAANRDKQHPLFGALKGLAFVPPGVDLTGPADPDWGNVHES